MEEQAKYDDLMASLAALDESSNKLQSLSVELQQLEQTSLTNLSNQIKIINSYLKNNKDDHNRNEMIKKKLKHLEQKIPIKPPSFILRLALGKSAPFIIRPFKLRLQYKFEYEIFKLFMSLSMCIFALICVSVPSLFPGTLYCVSSITRLIDALYSLFLLYYYSTVTLRELILNVNGSKIRVWWSLHHYISIAITAICLTFPSSYSYCSIRFPFLIYSLYLGATQYMQYRYQRARLYTLVALDKAAQMDTVEGDGVWGGRISRQFVLLLPFLLVAQGWQVYYSWYLWNLYWQQETSVEWQIVGLSILLGFLGIGNFYSTFKSYFKVFSGKRKAM